MEDVVTIIKNDDGTFTVRSRVEATTFAPNELKKALEEVVFLIRGKRPLLQVSVVDVDAVAKVEDTRQPVESKVAKSSAPEEEFYNGGLGPKISGKQNVNGFSPVNW